MTAIPVHLLGGRQFMKARTLAAPVVVVDARTFRVPSARDEGRDHRIQFALGQHVVERLAARDPFDAFSMTLFSLNDDLSKVRGAHQMSFGFSGGFCPTSLPLFQGSHC